MAKRNLKNHMTVLAASFAPDSSVRNFFNEELIPTTPYSALPPPTTSSRLRILGIWLLLVGLLVGLFGLASFPMSRDLIDSARINGEPDAMQGMIRGFWIAAGAGFSLAVVGALLIFLNPKGGATTNVQVLDDPAVTFSLEERLAKVQSLLDAEIITDTEYQQQRQRILDQS